MIIKHFQMKKTIQLILLLSGSRSYNIQELKDRFEISERTAYRYLNKFEDAGLVLNRDNGRYRFLQSSSEIKNLHRLFHFSEEEAEIFYHSLDNLSVDSETKIRLMRKLHALYDFKALRRMKDAPSVEKIQRITDGINHKKCVVLKNYRSSNSETVSDRRVEAFQYMEDYKAVWCYDLSDNKNKQFRISRIGHVEVLDKIWEYEKHHNLPFFDAFRMSATEPIARVNAVLTLKAYNLIREEYPLSEQYLEKVMNQYKLDIPIADFHGIGRFVLGLPGEIEVIEPKEFKVFLQQIKKRFID